MKTKKYILFLLVLLTISPIVISCSDENKADGKETSDTTQATEIIETELSDELPETKYDGSMFNIMIDGGTIANLDFIAEEETADTLNDAVFARNRSVEERFDVKINPEVIGYGSSFTKELDKFIGAGDNTFHVAMGMNNIAAGITSMIYEGKFIDWESLEYTNIDKPWWDSNIIRDLAFGNKVYSLTGDVNVSTLGNTRVLLFNKNLFTNLNIDYPYQDVIDMEWTHDNFKTIVKSGNDDINGDGVIKSSDDRYGYVGWQWDMGESIFIGYGANYTVKDSDNMPQLNLNNDRTLKVVDSILELFAEDAGGWQNNTEWGIDITIFNNGRSMFLNSRLYLLSNFRDMKDDFGIIPHPQYNKEQGRYYQSVDAVCTVCYIPISNNALDYTSVIMEAMASSAYKTVMPAYYEVVLQTKYSRDSESEEMIDIIKNNRCFPLQLNSFSFITIASFIRDNKNNLATVYAANETKAQTELDIIKKFYAESN